MTQLISNKDPYLTHDNQQKLRRIMVVITLLLAGRAMTLAFIGQVNSGSPGAPPSAWLMPLIGDAIIGVSALWIAYLIIRKQGLWVWAAIISWNLLAIWDAMSAYIIHLTNPWPSFFMIEIFGSSMFFMASAMHLTLLVLAWQPSVRAYFIDK